MEDRNGELQPQMDVPANTRRQHPSGRGDLGRSRGREPDYPPDPRGRYSPGGGYSAVLGLIDTENFDGNNNDN